MLMLAGTCLAETTMQATTEINDATNMSPTVAVTEVQASPTSESASALETGNPATENPASEDPATENPATGNAATANAASETSQQQQGGGSENNVPATGASEEVTGISVYYLTSQCLSRDIFNDLQRRSSVKFR